MYIEEHKHLSDPFCCFKTLLFRNTTLVFCLKTKTLPDARESGTGELMYVFRLLSEDIFTVLYCI